MRKWCRACDMRYDDAKASTICPHRVFLTDEQLKQKDLAISLMGKRVRFAHVPAGGETTRVTSCGWDGMVTVEGMSGEFAPHIFVEVPDANHD